MSIPAILNSNLKGDTYKKVIGEHAKDSLPDGFPDGLKNGIASSLSLLPTGVAETLIVGNFINGISQSIQEAMMQLVPRAGAGMLIRNTPLIAVDESILEIFQYIFSFILTTTLGATLAHPLAKVLDVPHFELLGKPVYELEKNLNKEIEIGTVKPKKVKINKELLGRISAGKLGMFAFLGIYCFFMEFLSSSLKVLLMDKLFDTSNFYTISGLNEKNEGNKDAGDQAVNQAKTNIRNVFIGLPLLVLSVLGAARLLKNRKSLNGSKFINKASKIFDLSDKFGHPKTLVAISVLTAGLFAYPSVARNKAEEFEVKFRVLGYSAPMAVFFKQFMGNILSWIAGLSMGLGNVLAPTKSYFKEVNEGSRNIFDLGLVGIQKNKNGEFSGRITELDTLKKLKGVNEAKYERALKTIHFMDHRAPYWMALLAGIGVSWINYLRTAKLHKQEQTTPSPIMNFTGLTLQNS